MFEDVPELVWKCFWGCALFGDVVEEPREGRLCAKTFRLKLWRNNFLCVSPQLMVVNHSHLWRKCEHSYYTSLFLLSAKILLSIHHEIEATIEVK